MSWRGGTPTIGLPILAKALISSSVRALSQTASAPASQQADDAVDAFLQRIFGFGAGDNDQVRIAPGVERGFDLVDELLA